MQSGRSRGFGFVYYEAPEDAREVGCTDICFLTYIFAAGIGQPPISVLLS